MSKNNFKNEIRERYKGRGNVWVRVNPTEPVFQDLMEKVKNEDSSEFLTHVEREGFAWMRFIKPLGNASSPTCLFEVRFRGSKIDHPDCTLELPDSDVKHLPLLGTGSSLSSAAQCTRFTALAALVQRPPSSPHTMSSVERVDGKALEGFDESSHCRQYH